jgi:hypothetical protein
MGLLSWIISATDEYDGVRSHKTSLQSAGISQAGTGRASMRLGGTATGTTAVPDVLSTYDHLVCVGAAGIRSCHSSGTAFPVPGELALLGRAADGQCVHAADITVTVAVIPLTASVPRGPHEDGAFPSTPLRHNVLVSVSVGLQDASTSE